MLREATDSLAPVSFLGRCLVPTLHKESAKTKQLEKGSLLYGIYLYPIANTIWLGLYFYRSVQLVPVQGMPRSSPFHDSSNTSPVAVMWVSLQCACLTERAWLRCSSWQEESRDPLLSAAAEIRLHHHPFPAHRAEALVIPDSRAYRIEALGANGKPTEKSLAEFAAPSFPGFVTDWPTSGRSRHAQFWAPS